MQSIHCSRTTLPCLREAVLLCVPELVCLFQASLGFVSLSSSPVQEQFRGGMLIVCFQVSAGDLSNHESSQR